MKDIATSSASSTVAAWFRGTVLAAVVAAGMVVLLGFARFPQITGSSVPYVALASVAVLVVGVPAALVLRITRARTGAMELARRRSLLLGGSLGAIWIAYTLATHFLIPDGNQPTLNAILLGSVLALTALLLVAGSATVALGSGRFTAGFASGVAMGFITGVLAMLTIALMLDMGMGFLVRHMNADELQGYASSSWTNRQAWYYWNEEFFGALGDFVLLLLSGAVLGAVGAGIGRLIAAARGG